MALGCTRGLRFTYLHEACSTILNNLERFEGRSFSLVPEGARESMKNLGCCHTGSSAAQYGDGLISTTDSCSLASFYRSQSLSSTTGTSSCVPVPSLCCFNTSKIVNGAMCDHHVGGAPDEFSPLAKLSFDSSPRRASAAGPALPLFKSCKQALYLLIHCYDIKINSRLAPKLTPKSTS